MRTTTFVGLALVGVSAAFGGPLERQNIPRNVAWVLHIDVEAGLASEVGRLVQERVGVEGVPARERMISQLNLDPLSDILGMTFYGENFVEHDGIAIITTTLAGEEGAGRLPALGLVQYASHEVGGIRVHQWVQNGRPIFGAILAGPMDEQRRVVLAGSEERLFAAAETIRAGAGDAGLPDPEGATVFAWARGMAQAPSPPKAATLRGIDSLIVRLGQRINEEGESVVFARAELTATTEKRALQIESMLKGMLSAVEMMGEDNPEFRPMSNLVAGAAVGVSGPNVSLSWSHPARAFVETVKQFPGNVPNPAQPKETPADPSR